MIRLSGLQWIIWTVGLTRHLSKAGKAYKPRSIITETHEIISKAVHIDGIRTQTVVSACKKNSRTYKNMISWDKVAGGPRQKPRYDATAKAGPIWEPVEMLFQETNASTS